MTDKQMKYVQTLADLGGGERYVGFDVHRAALGWPEAEYNRVTAALDRKEIVDAGWLLDPIVMLTERA